MALPYVCRPTAHSGTERVDTVRTADVRARSFNPDKRSSFWFRPFGPSLRKQQLSSRPGIRPRQNWPAMSKLNTNPVGAQAIALQAAREQLQSGTVVWTYRLQSKSTVFSFRLCDWPFFKTNEIDMRQVLISSNSRKLSPRIIFKVACCLFLLFSLGWSTTSARPCGWSDS